MDEIEEERRRREEVEDEKELLGQLHTPVTKQLPQEKIGGAMMSLLVGCLLLYVHSTLSLKTDKAIVISLSYDSQQLLQFVLL